MVDRRSIKEIIEEWIRKHPSRKSPEAGRRNIYFELQAIIILVSVFSLYHYPPVLGLPHADVLILDMTHGQNPSRAYFTDLLDRAHLSSLVYESVSVDMIRLIPTGNYRYIILWGHSGLNDMVVMTLFQKILQDHEPLSQALAETNRLLDSMGMTNILTSFKPQ